MSNDTRIAIEGGEVVTPETVISDGSLLLEGDRIVRVAGTTSDAPAQRTIDASGKYVLPGFVDLHGDEIERFCSPRSGERIDPVAALATSDRLNLAAGVTTKFDAVAFEDAPAKDRSPDRALELVEAIADADCLGAEHRIHARCEVTNAEAVEKVRRAADSRPVEIVSLMTHEPGNGQFEDEDAFARRYADGQGATGDAVDRVAQRRRAVDADTRRDRVDRLLSELDDDVLVASHDDGDPTVVDRRAERGVELCEYPITEAAAERARENGLNTAMGAPNLVRGESLWGNLSARQAVEAGLVDALCSDYRPRSLLEAAFVDTGEPLPERVDRIAGAPARVAGLEDRGALRPGARADVVLVDPAPVPTVARVFVAGNEVYSCNV